MVIKSARRFIFNVIRHFVIFYKKNYFRIQKIEKDKSSSEYVVTFFRSKGRQLFIKTTGEIMKDEYLLDGFDPLDAAHIGMYTARSCYEKLHEKKKLLV